MHASVICGLSNAVVSGNLRDAHVSDSRSFDWLVNDWRRTGSGVCRGHKNVIGKTTICERNGTMVFAISIPNGVT